jgi:hypothetical protein
MFGQCRPGPLLKCRPEPRTSSGTLSLKELWKNRTADRKRIINRTRGFSLLGLLIHSHEHHSARIRSETTEEQTRTQPRGMSDIPVRPGWVGMIRRDGHAPPYGFGRKGDSSFVPLRATRHAPRLLPAHPAVWAAPARLRVLPPQCRARLSKNRENRPARRTPA